MKIISLSFFILIFLSCENEQKIVNNNKSVRNIERVIDENCKYVETYFEDGTLKYKGKICNEKHIGNWKESRCTLTSKKGYWEGVYNHRGNVISSELDSLDIGFQVIKIDSGLFKVGGEYFIDIIPNSNALHTSHFKVFSGNASIRINKDCSISNFILYPEKLGLMNIKIFYAYKENGKVKMNEQNIPLTAKGVLPESQRVIPFTVDSVDN